MSEAATALAPGTLALVPEGFMVLPFPAPALTAMRKEVEATIARLTGQEDVLSEADAAVRLRQLTEAVTALTDDDYVNRFRKGQRVFTAAVARHLQPWMEEVLAPLLRANEIALTYVCAADRKTNPALSEADMDVYWRIVRPNKPDVAGPHRDQAFADLNVDSDRAIPLPFDYAARWRVWVPLLGCTMDNSLTFLPHSQEEALPVESITTPFGPRPRVPRSWTEANIDRFLCPFTELEGHCVLFPDSVIHSAPVNGEAVLRLSADFTVIMR